MPLGSQHRLTGGHLNSVIANAVVQIHRECTGRGPTKAQAFSRDNVVVLVMGEAMTKAERALVDSGHEDAARSARAQLQNAMREPLVRAIEGLTGSRVVAFMSDSNVSPDLIAELFILDRPPGRAGDEERA